MANRIQSLAPLVAAPVLLAIVLAIQCCGVPQGGTGLPIPSYSSLKPDQLTLDRCVLELAGSKYRADIQTVHEGNQVQFDLLAFGQVIESERYESTDKVFSVVSAGGESYEPPIPLVKYGMHLGDSWQWSGRINTGPEPHVTKAKVATSSEDLTINGGTVHNVVRVDVELSIYSGRPNSPSTRKLTFWIAPNMGVVKRAFGDYSARKPLEE